MKWEKQKFFAKPNKIHQKLTGCKFATNLKFMCKNAKTQTLLTHRYTNEKINKNCERMKKIGFRSHQSKRFSIIRNVYDNLLWCPVSHFTIIRDSVELNRIRYCCLDYAIRYVFLSSFNFNQSKVNYKVYLVMLAISLNV